MEAVELKLRTEQPADYRETENVTRGGVLEPLFARMLRKHYLLHVMRDSPAFVPELDLVAETRWANRGQCRFLARGSPR